MSECMTAFLLAVKGGTEDEALSTLESCKAHEDFRDACRSGLLDACQIGDARSLECASSRGLAKVVAALLALGANPTLRVQGPSGNTAAHLAALHGHHACLSHLLAAMKDDVSPAELTNNNGDTVLMFAAAAVAKQASQQPACCVTAASVHAVQALLRRGSRVGATNKDGITPLMLASAAPSAACVDLLLRDRKRGELARLVDLQDVNGNTALHYACRSGSVATCSSLLNAGASWLIRNVDGETPTQLAARLQHHAVARALQSFGLSAALVSEADGVSGSRKDARRRASAHREGHVSPAAASTVERCSGDQPPATSGAEEEAARVACEAASSSAVDERDDDCASANDGPRNPRLDDSARSSPSRHDAPCAAGSSDHHAAPQPCGPDECAGSPFLRSDAVDGDGVDRDTVDTTAANSDVGAERVVKTPPPPTSAVPIDDPSARVPSRPPTCEAAHALQPPCAPATKMLDQAPGGCAGGPDAGAAASSAQLGGGAWQVPLRRARRQETRSGAAATSQAYARDEQRSLPPVGHRAGRKAAQISSTSPAAPDATQHAPVADRAAPDPHLASCRATRGETGTTSPSGHVVKTEEDLSTAPRSVPACAVDVEAAGSNRTPSEHATMAAEWISQASALFLTEFESAAVLELAPQHLVGLGLGELSMAQLDALDDWHYRQLQLICEAKLAKHRQLRNLRVQEAADLAAEVGLLRSA